MKTTYGRVINTTLNLFMAGQLLRYQSHLCQGNYYEIKAIYARAIIKTSELFMTGRLL